MDSAQELLRQFIFFTSILAGFSFSVVVQFLSFSEKRKVTSVVITLITIAALSMMVSTFIGAVVLIKLVPYTTPEQIPAHTFEQIARAALFLFYLLIVGIIAFLIGLGLSGWIWSKSLGIVLSSFSVIAFVLMIWTMSVLLPA